MTGQDSTALHSTARERPARLRQFIPLAFVYPPHKKQHTNFQPIQPCLLGLWGGHADAKDQTDRQTDRIRQCTSYTIDSDSISNGATEAAALSWPTIAFHNGTVQAPRMPRLHSSLY
jgi:hypothetical protein